MEHNLKTFETFVLIVMSSEHGGTIDEDIGVGGGPVVAVRLGRERGFLGVVVELKLTVRWVWADLELRTDLHEDTGVA